MKSNRDANRLQFPVCAEFIDDMRKHFGTVTVHYVSEQGKECGERQTEGRTLGNYGSPAA